MPDAPNEPDFREHLGAAVIAELREEGVDLDEPHHLRFIFAAESEDVIKSVIAELEPNGFECEVDTTDDAWFCLAVREMPIDEAMLDAMGRLFTTMAAAKGAEFDDWDRVPSLLEMLAAGGELSFANDPDPADTERFPHSVSVRLVESIQPIDRGERYEDPLEAALSERGLGTVTGGGSQLAALGEIAFVRLDLQLADLDGALSLVQRTVENAGAPVGSAIEFERAGRDESIAIGTHHSLAIYFDGTTLPDAVYAESDLSDLVDLLNDALGAGAMGEVRDNWSGPTETALYLYGKDAQRMFAAVEPVLLSYPLGQNARVLIGPGSPNGQSREVRIPRRS